MSDTDELTTSEAAKLLGVSTSQLIRFANAGRIQVSRTLGGHRRFTRADVSALAGKVTS